METIKFIDLNDFLNWYEVISKEYQMPFDRPTKYPCLIAFTPIGIDLVYAIIYKEDLE